MIKIKTTKQNKKTAAIPEINQNRRRFLKFLAVGGGAGLLGSIFGSSVWDFFTGRTSDTIDQKNFVGFRIVQEGKILKVFSKKGEPIFIIDDEKE